MKPINTRFILLIIFVIIYELFFLQIFTACAFGETYYVSSSGNDTNNGTSTSTPWKTITKVNSITFTSGDVINFRGGDTFYGQINIKQSGITIRAYESGLQKPVISGAIRLSGWNVYKGSIYVTQASSLVKNLFANGIQMTLARYPNSGFLFINNTNGLTTIASTSLSQPSGYWNNANVRIRTKPYAFETRTVSSFSGTTISLSEATYFPIAANWGFYLDNKLSELDVPGEWFCDPADNKVYFYAPGGVDPNTLNVDGASLDYGIYVNSQSNITIQDLDIRYQTLSGIKFDNSTSNNIILNNNIYGSMVYGILVTGNSSYFTIDQNTIQCINGDGLFLDFPNSTEIINNTIKSIGLVQGYGISGTNAMMGIRIGGSSNTVRGNVIDSAGYAGIALYSSNTLAENNIVKNSMLKTMEGGSIYTYDGDGNIIRNNIIDNVVGDMDGMPFYKGKNSKAIHIDGGSHNLLIEGNTVSRVASGGIFVQYISYGNTIRSNTFIDCDRDTSYTAIIHILQNTNYSYGQHVIKNNIIVPKTAAQRLVLLQEENVTSEIHSLGIIDSNYYLNPYGNTAPFGTVKKNPVGWTWGSYSFEEWKVLANLGMDTHSKYIVPASSQRDTVFINSTASPIIVNLPSDPFHDLNGNEIKGSFTLAPYSSKVLIRDTEIINSTITVNQSLLSFGNAIINMPSQQSFIISGANLRPSTENITITTPSNIYQVSLLPESGYGTSLTIPYSGNTLSSTTVYVRFIPKAQQSYTGNITVSGGGAATQNITISGNGVPLVVNPISLTFGSVIINTISVKQTFAITGYDLVPANDSLTVTAPAGFSVSTLSGSGYASSIRVAYTNGTLPTKTVYVRFSPAALQSYSGNITVAGGGTTTKNIAVSGTGVTTIPTKLLVNPISLAFGNVIINTISAKQTFAITGYDLVPSNDSLTVTAPAGFSVSTLSGSGYASSIRVAYTNGTLPTKTVYVRFSPAALQSYSGNITVAGGGTTTKNIAVSGTGITTIPTRLVVNPISLTFGNVIVNTISVKQTFAITGYGLLPSNDSLTVTAPAGFSVSTLSGSGYASSIRVAYTNGTLPTKTVYVRFSPAALQSYSGNITVTGGGTTTKNIAVSGTGITTIPTRLVVNPISLTFGNVIVNTISVKQTFAITGYGLLPSNDSLTVTAPAGFSVSTLSGSGYVSSIRVAYTNGTLPTKTVYVRFSPAALQSYSGNITVAGGGTTTKNIAVSGTGITTSDYMISGNLTTDVFFQMILPKNTEIKQNYPNPFNPATTINYQLSETGRVHLSVFDILGREVATLVNEEKKAGYYSAIFNGLMLSSGTYFTRLIFESINGSTIVQVKKISLSK